MSRTLAPSKPFLREHINGSLNNGVAYSAGRVTEGGEIAADLPSGYSRGERQKPVSKAYKDNWNVIFAKKKSDNSRNAACCNRCSNTRRGQALGRFSSFAAMHFSPQRRRPSDRPDAIRQLQPS
jgi:hypothetical protein